MGNSPVGPDGLRVRQVTLTGAMLVVARMAGDDAPGEERLLVTRHGMFNALVRDAGELAGVVDLAELRPA